MDTDNTEADEVHVPGGSPSATAPAVTVFLPTRNAGEAFDEVLDAVFAQRCAMPFEVLAIDSGSTDGTLDRLRSRAVRLIEIPPPAFDHGATRDRAVREARGEIVAFLVQDALPADSRWLESLVACFDDPSVAGAYSRQVPRDDANPLVKSRLEAWAASRDERCVQEIGDRSAFDALPPLERMERVVFDNVSSAVRRSAALQVPFRRRRFGEDIDWGLRALEAGYRIVFEPRSSVVHSHDRSAWYELRRIYLDHQNLRRLFGLHTVPDLRALLASLRWEVGAGLRAVRADERLGPGGRIHWSLRALPHALAAALGQYLGARSVEQLELGGVLAGWLDARLGGGV